jgi:hypothetical protein
MNVHATLPGPTPVACRVGNGFVPVIHHPDRVPEYLRWERHPRKAKASPDEALAYAARVIWWRQRLAAEKRRRREAVDPRHAATIEGRAA